MQAQARDNGQGRRKEAEAHEDHGGGPKDGHQEEARRTKAMEGWVQ